MIDHMPRNNYPIGCETHMAFDCGCAGYPSMQTALRDCGNHCDQVPYIDRCIRCQAARLIDTLTTRSERYLERIIHLQDTIEELSPPAGHVAVHLPVTTVERIVTTDRMFPTLDTLRDAIQAAWEGQ